MTLHSDNSYASETPLTDGERVYAFFGNKGLYCYDFQGHLLWNKDLGVYEMQSDWGTGSSPLIHEGLVYLQIDNQEKSFLVAFEGKTGDERLRIPRQEKSNWCTVRPAGPLLNTFSPTIFIPIPAAWIYFPRSCTPPDKRSLTGVKGKFSPRLMTSQTTTVKSIQWKRKATRNSVP